jgi:3',5'-cyclic AMP phosphodiesterase CpdA
VRVWVFSDLHLDVNRAVPFQLPAPRPAHDLVVIAGDLCEDPADGVAWIAAHGLNSVPVVYVCGNHEFYGHDHATALAAGRTAAARHRNIHLLERDSLTIDGFTVLGASLWTDYRVLGDVATAMAMAERYMSDHRMIRTGDRAFTAVDSRALNAETQPWLEATLATLPDRSRTIVVTHHAPSLRSCGSKFAGHPLNAAFASDCGAYLPSVALWIHGHTHVTCDYDEAGCRVINNPRGYVPREQTGFRADLVLEV